MVSGRNTEHHLFLLRHFRNYLHSHVHGAINQPTGLPAGDLLMILGAQTKKPLTHIHDNENNVNLHATRRLRAFISLAGTWALKSLWETPPPLLCSHPACNIALVYGIFKRTNLVYIFTLRFSNWFLLFGVSGSLGADSRPHHCVYFYAFRCSFTLEEMFSTRPLQQFMHRFIHLHANLRERFSIAWEFSIKLARNAKM